MSPLNKIIQSLKAMDKNNTIEDLKPTEEDVAIMESVKKGMADLEKVIDDNANCKVQFKESINNGDRIQPCAYDKFIDSLSMDNYKNIDSILHFIKANIDSINAPTGKDGIREACLELNPI